MKISDLPEEYREVARENLNRHAVEGALTRRELMEALLNSEGIYGFARLILDFTDAISSAEESAHIRTILEREAAE